MNATDLQVIDILEITGPSTAGQLAELTGLTTGAITGMIDRLEQSGLVRRESDPNDGRRVLVRLSPSETAMKEIDPVFDSVGHQWDEIAPKYDDQ
jgi:DNA-binding MarR family transcriptional regulator